MLATQKEYDTLANRFNEVRSLCDSYLREIKELNNTVTELENLIDSHTSLT